MPPGQLPEVVEWVPPVVPPIQSHSTVSPTLMVVIAGLMVLLSISLKKISPTCTCLVAAVAEDADTHRTADTKSSFLNPRDKPITSMLRMPA